jgi:MFS family permease
MPHRRDEAAQGVLGGLHVRSRQLRRGLDPARAPEPDSGGTAPEGLGQGSGPGPVRTLADDRGPLDLIVRTTAASRHLLHQGPLALGELNQRGAGTAWCAHRYASCCQACEGGLKMLGGGQTKPKRWFRQAVLGSALCGAAASLPWLVAARIFQGLGGALLFAPGMAIITDVFPAAERGLALGLTTVVAALGVSAGPTLGGLITEQASWRWIFYLNVPLGVLDLLATWRVLGNVRRRTAQSFDPAGAGLLAVGFAAMALSLSFGQAWGWTSARLLTCLAISFVALIAAAEVERRVRHPIIDLALLHNRVFASSLLSMTLAMLALFAVSFLLPLASSDHRVGPGALPITERAGPDERRTSRRTGRILQPAGDRTCGRAKP